MGVGGLGPVRQRLAGEHARDEVGGDGFLIAAPVTRRNITEIADGLAPALRRRGLLRTGYEHDTFRENLLGEDVSRTGRVRA